MSPPSDVDRCECGHVRVVHEPHCVVTYYTAREPCPDDCSGFVLAVPFRPASSGGEQDGQ